MKGIKRHSIVWVGSKKRVSLLELKRGESKDVVQLNRRSCEKYWFGKYYSSSGKLALYYNRYWLLGIWDHELESHCVKVNDSCSVIVDDLDRKLKSARKASFSKVLLNIMQSKGVLRMLNILMFRFAYSVVFRARKLLK